VTFPSTREAKFAQALIDVVKAGDQEAFGAVVFEYDQVSRLDNWKTTILLKIKKSIEDEPGLT
jgi:alpha-soluble NSF attachment protein